MSLPLIVHQDISERRLKSVGLLASPTTIRVGLFADVPELKLLSLQSQEQTEFLIRDVIAGKSADILPRFQKLLEQFDVPVILGCTELSVLNSLTSNKNVIDPLELAVERIFHD